MVMNAKTIREVFSFIMILAGLFFSCIVLISLILGEPPPLVVSLGKPKTCILTAAACLSTGFISGYACRHTRKQLTTLAGRITLLGAGTVISLIAGELGLRIYLNNAQGFNNIEQLEKKHPKEMIHLTSNTPLANIIGLSPDKKLVYELMPNLNIKFGHKTLITNSSGFREETEYSKKTPDNTIRIIGIGDSGMFGWNTMQGECYLDVLEKNIQKQKLASAVEVINMAVPGYNTEQEVEMLELRGIQYKPDIVIVGWCDNDFSPPFFLYRKKDFLRIRSSALYTLLFYRKQNPFAPEVFKASEIATQTVDPCLLEGSGLNGVTNEMKRLSALASKHDFKILIFGPMNDHIIRICKNLGLDYYNTWTEIPEGKYPKEYAIHFMHPKPKGHAALAENLEKHLKEKGWISETNI